VRVAGSEVKIENEKVRDLWQEIEHSNNRSIDKFYTGDYRKDMSDVALARTTVSMVKDTCYIGGFVFR